MLIEQMIDFVEELPTEWQQQREQIQHKFGPAQEPVTSMLLLNAYDSFHIPDKSPNWISTTPLFASVCLYKNISDMVVFLKGRANPCPRN